MLIALLNEALESYERELHDRYRVRLRGIRSRVGPEDIFQTTALKAVEHLETCRAETLEEMKRWLSVIAKNVYRNVVDKEYAAKRSPKKEQRDIHYDVMAPQESASESIEDNELYEAILEELADLPVRQASAVRMRYLDDMDFDQIAVAMQITSGCARTLVSRGQSRIISRIRGTD